jgi:hypothetical protein
MKIHSTNYINTFIEVAEDCPTAMGTIPLSKKDTKSIAEMQFEMVANNPYKFTSDEIYFEVFALRNDITQSEYNKAREEFFSKGQPCFRASPLTKRYGFGVHSDNNAKVAIFGIETNEYEQFLSNPNIKKVKAMRNAKK